MIFEYEDCYAIDEPLIDLSRRGIDIDALDSATLDLVVEAWKSGFDRGANMVQQEWDAAEDLQMEREAGWDW